MTWTTDRPGTRRARWAGVSVAATVGQFTAAGLLVLLTVAATTGLLARDAGSDQAEESFEALTRVSASALLPALEGALHGDTAARTYLGRQIADVRAAGPVVHVRVWNGAGTLLWADDGRLVGRTFPLTGDERRVLRDGTVGAGGPGPEVPGSAAASGGERVLDAYAGLATASGQRLLVDLSEPDGAVRATDRAAWLRISTVALGALVLLQLVHVPLAWRLARRLRRSEEAEAELLQATVTASERERRRIAADLHDNVVQDLTGVAYELDAARLHRPSGHVDVDGLLDRTAMRLRAGIDELRAVLVSLHPTRAPAGGLAAALSALATEFEEDGLQVSVRTSGVERIPPPVATAIHRAAREGLRNVRSHGDATAVELSVRCERGWATVVVEDDGRGFDATRLAERTATGHLGLRALGDRLASAGGTLTAASAPGEGTRLAITLPLDAPLDGSPVVVPW